MPCEQHTDARKYCPNNTHTPLAAPLLQDGNLLGFSPHTPLELPLYLTPVAAGFPSPADDYIDQTLDLNEHLVAHPAATFFVRACGDSMLGAGIHNKDILVVDRALNPKDRDVIIAALDGELTVKRIRNKNGHVWLLPENPDYKPIQVGPEACFEIWGVVTYVIHKV
ncbi:LexA family protein [Desulfovibrio ferrophilus]|uniref:DNA polymerase V subunit D n=1 Tax=Desulfovibrio ferrophilus TaxID=241368 RepID=A0A2Z6AYP5_9BACT|nr:translesion error-prone DNA polymerase V autoproteolytic subunit [Desulfovibrio ferrophilus]BBD08384.1 DNA polymerase V subunit D [Desulfovibrio ferrophilus]